MPQIIPFRALVPEKYLQPCSDFVNFSRQRPPETLFTDTLPHLYLYLQYFKIPEQENESCRKGIIGLVPGKDLDQILKHENTISENVRSLTETMMERGISLEPVHAFIKEKNQSLDDLKEEDLKLIADFTDEKRIRNILYKITNSDKSGMIQRFYESKTVFIADGHHRFQAQQELLKMKGNSGALLIYLCDLHQCPENIQPVHRLLTLTRLKKSEFFIKLSEYFTVSPSELSVVLSEIHGKKYYFGLYTGEKCFVLKLRERLEDRITWPFHPSVKKMDLTVLHYYAFMKAAGIKGSAQKDSREINFSSIFTECVSKVNEGKADAVFFCNPAGINDVIMVAESGNVLPQKSTSFFPKVNSGLVFASIDK